MSSKSVHFTPIALCEANGAIEQFRQELEPVLIKKGWWGRDRETGKMLGTPWRLKTIFQTNLRVSAAQGEWRTAQELKGLRPYLWYNAILDKRTRPLHASWDNIVLPVDDPWWNTHFPPNGWNCRCKALSLDEDDIAMHGLKITEKAPDDGFMEWENPATGEKITVPNGIDPGWAYNPGATDQAAKCAKIAVDKMDSMPAPVAASALDVLFPHFPEQIRTTLGRLAVGYIVARGLRAWLAKPEKPFPLGVISREDAKKIGAHTQIAKMSAETLAKQKDHHPELTFDDYALAQDAIAFGDVYEQDERNIAYVLEYPAGMVVIVKATMEGDGLYVTSLYRISRKKEKRQRAIENLLRIKRK